MRPVFWIGWTSWHLKLPWKDTNQELLALQLQKWHPSSPVIKIDLFFLIFCIKIRRCFNHLLLTLTISSLDRTIVVLMADSSWLIISLIFAKQFCFLLSTTSWIIALLLFAMREANILTSILLGLSTKTSLVTSRTWVVWRGCSLILTSSYLICLMRCSFLVFSST